MPLNSRAFDTLVVLVRHAPDGLIDKDRLMKAVWPDTVVEENSLNKAISQIRRALGEKPGEHRFIVTVPGRGFGFVPRVQELNDDELVAAPLSPPEHVPDHSPPENAHEQLPPAAAISQVAAGVSKSAAALRLRLIIIGAAAAAALALASFYVLSHRVTASTAPASSITQKSARTGPSIIVLPLINLSPAPDEQYFADGLSEELMNELGEISGLRVIGRSSAFALASRRDDLSNIARTLGVSHVLEGSVRRSGNELRITVRLNEAETGVQVWSSTYERERGDIFKVQEEIARSVASKLRLSLRPDGERRRGSTSDVEAYEAYLASSAQLTRVSAQGDMRRTIAELERAVVRDPDFASGWEALGLLYAAMSDLGYAPDEESNRKSMRAVTRALELAPDSPRILSSAAMMSMQLRDWSAAEKRLLKALNASNGENFYANLIYGWFLENVGRSPDAFIAFRRAQAIDPLSPRVAMQIETNHLIRGDFEGAESEHVKALKLATHYPWGKGYDYLRDMAKGDRAAVLRTLENGPTPLEARLRTVVHESGDMRRELKKQIDEPQNQALTLRMDILAHWAVFFGENDLALHALRKAFGPGTNSFYLWRLDLKPLRRTPEFKALVRDLGLHDYWRTTGNWGDACKPVGTDDFECN